MTAIAHEYRPVIVDPCPFGHAWCVDHRDWGDGDEFCQTPITTVTSSAPGEPDIAVTVEGVADEQLRAVWVGPERDADERLPFLPDQARALGLALVAAAEAIAGASR